ncbi:hypothetical protein FQR65_LT10184 [Abscondita terminalis]|nr:hypothetical protein FQR65_LT10184 [Abscondita terminalis]
MVKAKRGYVFASALISAIAVGLSLVSLTTEQWVVAQGELGSAANEQLSQIKYGLFSGVYVQQLSGIQYFAIYATCLISKNVCAYLCSPTSEMRLQELKMLYRNEKPQFSCIAIPKKNKVIYDVPSGGGQDNTEFIKASYYISTIIFLVMSIIFGFISAILSMWNTVGNPAVIFGIYAIYIYNTIACISTTMVLIVWGALFGSHIVKNVGISDTITGYMSTSGLTNLGFSYWLLLPSTFLYASSIFVLYLRHYFVSEKPQVKLRADSDDADARDMMIF